MQRHVETHVPILQLEGLQRSFHQGSREIRVLDDASAVLNPGQAVALVGPSGAGKSTLLHIAGLLETPDSGRVLVNGQDCARMNDAERTAVRRDEMGFLCLIKGFMLWQNQMGNDKKSTIVNTQ